MLKVTRSKNVTSFIRFETDFYDRLRNQVTFQGNRMKAQADSQCKGVVVLDTSAFLAGFDPFSLSAEQVTVPKVEEEILRNSMVKMRFETAIESGKLRVKAPTQRILRCRQKRLPAK